MPKRFRLTRRFPVAMTEDGYRRLKRFATEAGLDEGEALSFLFEHFDSVTDKDNLTHRLRLFTSLAVVVVSSALLIAVLGTFGSTTESVR